MRLGTCLGILAIGGGVLATACFSQHEPAVVKPSDHAGSSSRADDDTLDAIGPEPDAGHPSLGGGPAKAGESTDGDGEQADAGKPVDAGTHKNEQGNSGDPLFECLCTGPCEAECTGSTLCGGDERTNLDCSICVSDNATECALNQR